MSEYRPDDGSSSDVLIPRELYRSTAAYRTGHRAERVSPLERYPIIDCADGTFLVPNFRYFDLSSTELLHYILQEEYTANQFNETLGRVQEIYVSQLIRTRLPDECAISELEYRRAKGQNVRGPDETIIEPGVGLVAVESKSKRITAKTRVEPTSDLLLEDLHRGTEALVKLPAKIADIYSGLKEYAEYQDRINQTLGKDPICVVVFGESVWLMQEILIAKVREDPNHPLANFPYPIAVMSLETFETAIEICANEKTSLYDL